MISYVGSTPPDVPTNVYTPDVPHVLTNPGCDEGDLLIAQFAGFSAGARVMAWITPEGWFPLDNNAGGVSGNETYEHILFYKIATNSEPGTYGFSPSSDLSNVGGMVGAISVWRGVDPISPIIAVQSVAVREGDPPHDTAPFQLTVPAFPLPIANAKALLFGTVSYPFPTSGASSGTITNPPGATVRYQSVSTQDFINVISLACNCADIDVTGGTTASYVWDYAFSGSPAVGSGPLAHALSVVVVLRALADADLVTWEVYGNPDRAGETIDLYTRVQEGILLGPGSANLYTVYGEDFGTLRQVIARYSRANGTLQASATIADYIIDSGEPMPMEVSADDLNFYWASAFENTSPDNSSGRVYRHETVGMTQQATSAWLPDDDAIITLRIGTPGKWSAGFLFGASGFLGDAGHGIYVFNKTTLVLDHEVPYNNFFTDISNGFLTDMTVDCNGDVWALGQDDDRPVVLFRVESDDTTTAYDVSMELPGALVIGLHPRLDALIVGQTTGISLWDLTTHLPTASYTLPAYAEPWTSFAAIRGLKSSLLSQNVGIVNAGLWITLTIGDRPLDGAVAAGYRVFYSYLQKLNEDDLSVETTYAMPTGKGIVQCESPTLDTGQAPYRLWGWGRYAEPKFGGAGWSGPGPMWLTTAQVPGDKWGIGTPTLQQLIHARGFEFRSLLSAAVPTIAGIGSRVCGANVEVRTTLIVAEVFVKPQPPQKIPEVPPPLVFVNGVLQKLTGSALPMEVCGGYVGHPVTHSQLQQVRANYTDKLAPLSSDVHCFHTEQIGEADVQGKPAALSKKNSWFHLRQTDRYHRVCLVCEGEAETTALTYMLREAGVR